MRLSRAVRVPTPDSRPSADEFVDLAIVPLMDGPLLVSALEATGLEIRHHEAFSLGLHTTASVRILVRQGDLDEANALLRELLG